MINKKYDVLKNKFGYTSFRPGQEEVIDAILSGRDVLALMPTGAGKSICYQIPALLLPGMTVVISPLISLMKDQVNALQEAGIDAAFLNSSLSNIEYGRVANDVSNGHIKILYLAPERLLKNEIYEFFSGIDIPLVVVDEAHCVSQWGHDFRTSYLKIADFIKSINGVKRKPVTASFTATATVKVREDIEKLLALRNSFFINTGFDRPNLHFAVNRQQGKTDALLECLSRHKDESGIIYCATRKTTEEVAAFLVRRGFSAACYHAGLDDGGRRMAQDDFIYDRVTIMVATNAFGMGIDKSNVSFVIHYNMPKNIESYYQEAGRAGRDGSPAECLLLYSGQDVQINKFLITHNDEDRDPQLEHHNLELLKQMTFYATCNDCLRKRLLAYFGEEAPLYCGNCSNCQTGFEERDMSLEGRKIVSCVYRLKQRGRSFGKNMIIDILRGSENEKIRRFGFDSLSTYGIMKDTSAQRIRLIIDALIKEKILVQEEGEYPVIVMGNTALQFLKEERNLVIKLPKEQKPKKNVNAKKLHFISDESIDDALYAELKKLRKEIAAKEAVPAYIIFSDAALRDICRKKPVSLIQFSGVNGVGRVKLEKYGEAFTELIRKQITLKL